MADSVVDPAPKVWIDEQGADETGDGSAEKPFQTAVKALTVFGLQATVLIRKSTGGEYEPLGTTALKKAKKTVELNERKAKKSEGQKAEREREHAEQLARDAKRIEESKKLLLVEDTSLPTAIKVKYMRCVS